MQLARGFSNHFQGPHDIGEKRKNWGQTKGRENLPLVYLLSEACSSTRPTEGKGKREPTSCILTVGGMLLYEAYRRKRERGPTCITMRVWCRDYEAVSLKQTRKRLAMFIELSPLFSSKQLSKGVGKLSFVKLFHTSILKEDKLRPTSTDGFYTFL